MSDALVIANRLEGVRVREHYDLIPKRIAANELRRQHAEIESLRAQLEARVRDDAERTLREALAAAENAKTDPDEPEAAWALIEQRHLATLAQAAKLSAAPSQPVAQPEHPVVAYNDPWARTKSPAGLMACAHAMCPIDLPHLKKMEWMADYYERNRLAEHAKGKQ